MAPIIAVSPCSALAPVQLRDSTLTCVHACCSEALLKHKSYKRLGHQSYKPMWASPPDSSLDHIALQHIFGARKTLRANARL